MPASIGPTSPSAPFDPTGHVALVTGGNGGVGLGMAKGLAGAGCEGHRGASSTTLPWYLPPEAARHDRSLPRCAQESFV